jgi:hypothetical protein
LLSVVNSEFELVDAMALLMVDWMGGWWVGKKAAWLAENSVNWMVEKLDVQQVDMMVVHLAVCLGVQLVDWLATNEKKHRK